MMFRRPGLLRARAWVAPAVLTATFLLLLAGSLLIGSKPLAPALLWQAIIGGLDDEASTLLLSVRLPRTLAAVLVGTALACAGALMQSMTRNPLAEPGLLGVSAGAAFAVTIALGYLAVSSATGIAVAAVLGAAIMTGLVLALGLRGRNDGVRLVLAGVAFSMTVAGIQTAMTLVNPRALDAMRAWSAGSVAAPDAAVLTIATPLLAAALLAAALLARPLNALALGDDAARGLGSHPASVRTATAVVIALLTGAAVAIAGPISFIGLMVPHIVRPFTGPHAGRVLFASAAVGPILLLVADILSRIVLWPGELPVGVMTAAIGAPLLLFLVRRQR